MSGDKRRKERTPVLQGGEYVRALRSVSHYLVIVFFIISIAFSATSSDPGSMILWILTGLIGIVFLKVAFPKSFLYGLWLLSVYVLSGVGVLFIDGIGLTGGQGLAVGVLLEIIAFYIIYHLIFQVKGLRDIGEGPYVPLGLWSVAVLLFFFFSNGAMASLVSWAQGPLDGGGLGSYVSFEVLIVLLVVFIFVRAEQCVVFLEEGPKAIRKLKGPRSRHITRDHRARLDTKRTIKRPKLPGRKGKGCPICDAQIRTISRSCPECGGRERTAICRSGHIFIPCPSCGTANFHGRYRCRRCNARLSEMILCTKCGVENELSHWRKRVHKKEGKARARK